MHGIIPNRRPLRYLSSLVVSGLLLQTGALAQVAQPASNKAAPRPAAKGAAGDDNGRKVVHPLFSVSGMEAHIATVKAAAKAKAEKGGKGEAEREREKERGKKGGAEEGEEEAGEYWESYLYRMKMRAFPYNTVDLQAMKRAVQHRDKMPALNLSNNPGATAPGPKAKAAGAGGISKNAGGPGSLLNSPARWEFTGPRRLGIPYQVYYGPPGTFLSGRVNGVAYDPTRAGTVFITGAQGGVWRSLDSGRNWTPLGDQWPAMYATAVAVNPETGAVFVGTGDFNGSQGAGFAQGIERSTDGGNTWSIVAPQLAGQCVSRIVIDPDSPNIMLASTGRGVIAGGLFRSTDSGTNWVEVTPTGQNGDWSDLTVGASNGSNRIYYAARVGQGVFRSLDAGQTWTRLNVPLAFNNPASPAGGLGLRITASRVNPNMVYVMDASDASQDGRIFRSNDGGTTWTDISGNYPTSVGDGGNINNFSQASYDLHLSSMRAIIAGVPTDIIYGGAIALGATVGGQGFWTDISFTLTPFAKTHNDQQSFAENPLVSNLAMFGNDGGIYGLTFNPLTQSWFIDGLLNATLGVTQFYHADWSLTNPNLMIGGTQDNATPRTDGQTLSAWGNVGGGDGGGCAINIANNNIQYTTAQGGPIFRTTNNWAGSGQINPDWRNTNQVTQASNPPFVGVVELGQAPTNPNWMYYGTQFLWRWSEAAGWLVDTSMPPKVKPMGDTKLTNDDNNFVTAIAVAPGPLRLADGSIYTFVVGQALKAATAGNVVYAGTSDGQLWVTFNALDTDVDANTKITWTRINAASLPTRAITSISVDPSNAGDILVGLSGSGTGHLYRLANVLSPAKVFTNQSGFGAASLPDISLNDVSRDPVDPANTFYVATDVGVFATIDAGSTWYNATQSLGLPNVECNAIQANDRAPRGTGFLNVATFGRGMWRILLPNPSAPDIQVSQTIARGPTSYQFTLNLVNKGGGATNVRIENATLVTDRGVNIPRVGGGVIVVGDMPPGAVRLASLTFARNANSTPGTGVTLNVTISRGGVTQPVIKLRTRLP
jgi:hypothetical protein